MRADAAPSYLILGMRRGRVVRFEREAPRAAFCVALRLRVLGWAVTVLKELGART